MSSTPDDVVKKEGVWTVNGWESLASSCSVTPTLFSCSSSYKEATVPGAFLLIKNLPNQIFSRPRETVKVLSHCHPPNIPGKSIVTLLVTLPYNAATPPHTHNGAAVTALMLRGSSLNQMNCDEPRVYVEGETWYEAPGCHHVRSENSCKTPGEEAAFYAVLVIDDEVIEKEGYAGLAVLDVDLEEMKKKGTGE